MKIIKRDKREKERVFGFAFALEERMGESAEYVRDIHRSNYTLFLDTLYTILCVSVWV